MGRAPPTLEPRSNSVCRQPLGGQGVGVAGRQGSCFLTLSPSFLLFDEPLPVQLAERPDPEEAEKAARATRQALDRLVDGKISAAQPKTLPQQPGAPQFIKYTPSQQGPQYNSGATQRIIRMQVGPGHLFWLFQAVFVSSLVGLLGPPTDYKGDEDDDVGDDDDVGGQECP